MALDPENQKRMDILKFLKDCGGSCSEEQWRRFDSRTVHLDTYVLELEASRHMRHDSENKRYYLTPEGNTELAYLESVTDSLSD